MIYELFLRLFGAGITGLIQFLPFSVEYDAAAPLLSTGTTLTAPVTREARRLVETGMSLRIDYSLSLIVNNVRAYHQSTVHKLEFAAGTWTVDDTLRNLPFDTLQRLMGRISIRKPGLKFDERDRITLFVKATILPDSGFTKSTRMNTDVLWNCRIPTRKETFLFTNGRFERE